MAAAPTLVGREAELEQLREVVQGDEAPFVAFVEGEAASGRPRCSRRSAARPPSPARGAVSTPDRGGGRSSYAALDDLLRPAIDRLHALPAPQRRALAAALLLEDASEPDRSASGRARHALPDRRADASRPARRRRLALAGRGLAAVLSFVLRRLVAGARSWSPPCAAARPTRPSPHSCAACHRTRARAAAGTARCRRARPAVHARTGDCCPPPRWRGFGPRAAVTR